MVSDLFLAKSLLQRMPLVDFLDGVGEIEGWIHQQVLLDADRSLLGIDHAQMSAFTGAQACPDSRRPRESCMKAYRRQQNHMQAHDGQRMSPQVVEHSGIAR